MNKNSFVFLITFKVNICQQQLHLYPCTCQLQTFGSTLLPYNDIKCVVVQSTICKQGKRESEQEFWQVGPVSSNQLD
jgi:hypothetical protein